MDEILQKLNFQVHAPKFQAEKVTPDVVCRLSAQELQTLGISNTADMMKLRTECIKYGREQPLRVQVDCGSPKFYIPKSILENFLENGYKIAFIATMLSVSESTVYRRMGQYGLSKMDFSNISDAELDILLGEIMKGFPLCGETMLLQMLKVKGVHIQRWRLRESIHRIDESGVRERSKGRLHRRVYNVQGPNHLWHIDTNHKLIRWRFVIVGGIDGFSRLVVFLKCTDNNTSETVLQCFMEGVDTYGIPNRCRSDKGLENVSVADYMIASKGQGSMITGKSTHNQRIERLWRDVFDGVLIYFYHLFYYMEDQGVLDPLNQTHLAVLHFVFSQEINSKLRFWSDAWAGHRMRTTKSSPLAMWTSGQLQNPVGIDENVDLENFGVEGVDGDVAFVEGERPIFQSLSHLISDQCREALRLNFRWDMQNGTVEDFQRCLSIVDRYNA